MLKSMMVAPTCPHCEDGKVGLESCDACGGEGVVDGCECELCCEHDDVVENGICACGAEVDWVARTFRESD